MKCKPLIKIFAGKALMAKTILSLIPEHLTYVEVFAGGAAVFFQKEPAGSSILNDINGNFCTAYRVFKEKKEEIIPMLQESLYSRELYRKAVAINKNPEGYTEVEIAWAVIYGHAVAYRKIIGSTFATYPRSERSSAFEYKIFRNYVDDIECQADKLKYACIENMESIKLIKKYDREGTLFYCDPPYIGTEMVNIGTYTSDNYRELLETLSNIKGKFILSCFDTPEVREYLGKNPNWTLQEHDKYSPIKVGVNKNNRKTEFVIFNY